MRISGLASGFDTDEMVKQLMKVERMKVDRVEQNKQTVLWRQEQYNSVNKKFANFLLNTQKDLGLKKSSSTGALFGNSYKNVDYVRKAVSSDESVATVTTTSNAINGSYKFTVDKLAENANFSSGENGSLEDLSKYGTERTDGEKKYLELEFKINDQTIKISKEIEEGKDRPTISMDDLTKAINSTKVDTFQGKVVKDGKIELEDGSSRELTEKEREGIVEGSLGVTAFSANGKFFIQTEKTGKDAKIEMEMEIREGQNSNFLKDLGYTGPGTVKGKNTEITYNDTKLEYDSNNINLNGLNIELKAESTKAITINVSTNVDGIIEKVEKFVEEYNKLIDEISGLTTEKVYRDYKPLSPEERKSLSEEDLKLWDEKAKSGLLNRDETLTRTLQTMRSNIYKSLEGEGTFTHITQIGISTEKYAMGTSGGKLQIDMDKLRDAIVKDADGVMDLLFQEGDDSVEDGKSNTTSKGVFNRIYDDLIDGMKNIIDKSGPGNDEALYRSIRFNMLIDFRTKKGSISDLDKSINQMNKEIANLNILLGKKEESHYAKFTAMEKAMYQMNNQSEWLYQQMQF